ncbi:MAG: GNAT family N-acetyltransferase [Fermentimonas sp.]|jgi:ribosomal protein S18 acetylase RimI-like enzyme
MKIERVTHIDDNILKAFQKFIPELTKDPERIPTKDDLKKVIQSPNNYLFIATKGNNVLGSLTLAFYNVPSGIKAWIEDVIVDDEARGQGVATALISHAIETAELNGATKLDLSSQPWRQAANNLYVKMGFKRRDTNMYRLTLNQNL